MSSRRKRTDADKFNFHFDLGSLPDTDTGTDPLVDIVAVFLRDIQNIGYLTRNGKRVYIDGFVLHNESETVRKVPKPATPGRAR